LAAAPRPRREKGEIGTSSALNRHRFGGILAGRGKGLVTPTQGGGLRRSGRSEQSASMPDVRTLDSVRVEPIEYGDRRVYPVSAFNRGIASWLSRLPTVWVEGEVTELRRQERWQTVFFTLKDPGDGSCLSANMPSTQFDALRLDLANGERVHVYGRPELFARRGDLRLRALSIERFGLADHLAALDR